MGHKAVISDRHSGNNLRNRFKLHQYVDAAQKPNVKLSGPGAPASSLSECGLDLHFIRILRVTRLSLESRNAPA